MVDLNSVEVSELFHAENLETVFEKAAIHVRKIGGQLDPSKLLYFYARYKQAKVGPCNIPKPGFFDFQGKQKWATWTALGNMSNKDAMTEYIQEVDELDPDWLLRFDESAKDKSPFGVTVSSLVRMEVDLSDDDKTLFDWVKEGNESKVRTFLQENCDKDLLTLKDQDGMTVLHWCCDRGHASIAEFLLSEGCSINSTDSFGQSSLHYAVSCGHLDVVRVLLSRGADKTIKDDDDCLPMDLAENDQMRLLLAT